MTSMARREVEGRESKRGRAREGEGRGSGGGKGERERERIYICQLSSETLQ